MKPKSQGISSKKLANKPQRLGANAKGITPGYQDAKDRAELVKKLGPRG
jgi:hypothetical protein